MLPGNMRKRSLPTDQDLTDRGGISGERKRPRHVFAPDQLFYKPYTSADILRKLSNTILHEIERNEEHAPLDNEQYAAQRRGRANSQQALTLNALRYLPHAVFKWLEHMPPPWEPARFVSVIFHHSGALVFVKGVHREPEVLYRAYWACWCAHLDKCWQRSQRAASEQTDGTRPTKRVFLRLRLPAFDDEEPPLSFRELVYPRSVPNPFQNDEEAIQAWQRLRQLGRALYRPEARVELYRRTLPWVASPNDMDPSQFYLRNRLTLRRMYRLRRVRNRDIITIQRNEIMPSISDILEVHDWDEFTELSEYLAHSKEQPATELSLAYPYLYDAFDERIPNPEQPDWHYHAPRPIMWAPTAPHFQWPFAWCWQPTLAPLHRCQWSLSPELPANSREPHRLQHPSNRSVARSVRFCLSGGALLADLDLTPYGTRVQAWLDLLYAPRAYQAPSALEQKRAQDISLEKDLFWRSRRGHYTRPKSVAAAANLLQQGLRQADACRVRCLRKQRRGRKRPRTVSDSDPAAGNQRRLDLLQTLSQSGFFYRTEMDWLEVGLLLCRAARSMFLAILKRKRFSFLSIDYNFQLQPSRTLTTKERKQARFGNAFHLMRELMRMVKLIVDVHLRYRAGLGADAIQLADSIMYLGSHLGELTGIYRYKYRLMRQIRATKDLKHLIYQRFRWSGPGKSFWQPVWRQWLHLLRGLMPLLEQWLGNLLNRHFEGREPLRMAQRTVTRQRLESQFDVALRQETLMRIRQLFPADRQALYTRRVLQHMQQAWRCWKANVPWYVEGMPPNIDQLIRHYVQQRAQWWVTGAKRFAMALQQGRTMDKDLTRQMYGRLARLAVRREQERQMQYLQRGPFLQPSQAASILSTFAAYLDRLPSGLRSCWQLPWSSADPSEPTLALALLQLAVERLRPETESERCPPGLTAVIEEAEASPSAMLYRIQNQLQSFRGRHEVELRFYEDAALTPVYLVEPFERLMDAFLDQWLWYQADRTGLFPSWVQPNDAELPPVHVFRVIEALDRLPGLGEFASESNNQLVALIQTPLPELFERADLLLLDRLLRLFLADEIVDYIVSRSNAVLNFKNMRYTQSVGISPGWEFSGFLMQLYGLAVVDLPILEHWGDTNTAQAISPKQGLQTADQKAKTDLFGRVLYYERILDRIYLLVRVSRTDAQRAVQQFLQQHAKHPLRERLVDDAYYPNRRCWPSAERMRLRPLECHFGRALFDALRALLGAHTTALLPLAEMPESHTMVSVASGPTNPSLFFEMFGFEVRLVPTEWDHASLTGTNGSPAVRTSAATRWSLASGRMVAYLQVSPYALQHWIQEVQRLLMATIHAPFTRVAARWNALALHFAGMYREVAANAPAVRRLVHHAQERVQNRIKLGLNSKMPVRFPPVVFYAPRTLGGLEMVNIGYDAVPVFWSFLPSWRQELMDSELVERELQERQRSLGVALDARLLPSSWMGRGLPRLAARFHPRRELWALDHGYRLRHMLRVHVTGRRSALWWVDNLHDGRLWELDGYRAQTIQALGGAPSILAHTLFAATGYRDWRGMVWSEHGFEHKLAGRRLTRAQRTGLVQIPNRRFTLWWSPTINRSRVYMGFRAQLDLTGIFMYGKLSTLKISLLQVFRGHLWQRIHESIVLDLCTALDAGLTERARTTNTPAVVQRERIHPRKSYRMHWSSADIRIDFGQPVRVSSSAMPLDAAVAFESARAQSRDATRDDKTNMTSIFWLDVQLRWGDYDDHDAAQYAALKFREYTSPGASSLYPAGYGLLVVFDLAYAEWSAFGHAGALGVASIVAEALPSIANRNQALALLRERIRKALQLYAVETVDGGILEASSPAQAIIPLDRSSDLWRQRLWIVDDRNAYRIAANGVIWVWETTTGRLFVKIVHRDTWAGQTRRAQLAKWKAAEQVLSLLRSQPVEEQPQAIVLSQAATMDPMKTLLAGTEHAHIPVRLGAASMPLQALLALDALRDHVQTAHTSELLVCAAYADWLEHVSVWTASARFLLLLRALERAPERVHALLWPRRSHDETVVWTPARLWPAYSETEWRQLELELRKLAPSRMRPEMSSDARSSDRAAATDASLEASPMTVPSFDRYGNVIIVETTTPYERQSFGISGASAFGANISGLLPFYRLLPRIAENLLPLQPPHRTVHATKETPSDRSMAPDGCYARSKLELHLPRNLVRGLLLSGEAHAQIWGTHKCQSQGETWMAWALVQGNSETPAPTLVQAAACFARDSVQAIGWIQVRPALFPAQKSLEATHSPNDIQVLLTYEVEEHQWLDNLPADGLSRDDFMDGTTHTLSDAGRHASRMDGRWKIDVDVASLPDSDARLDLGHVATAEREHQPGCRMRAWTGGGSGDAREPQSIPVTIQLRDDYLGVFLESRDGDLCARPPKRFGDLPYLVHMSMNKRAASHEIHQSPSTR
jgi:pre-mRNA-processing factor 8